jgi:hypothetical protein
MSQVGCYTLDLYCDNENAENCGDGIHGYKEFPITFTHEKGSVCRSMARKDGWILGKDGSAICPKCSGKKP